MLAVAVHGGPCHKIYNPYSKSLHVCSKYMDFFLGGASIRGMFLLDSSYLLSCLNIILYHQVGQLRLLHNIYKRREKKVCLHELQSSLGIHLLHQRLFLRRLSSSMLSFNVLTIFLWSQRAEARAFLLEALAFFLLGSISCTV